MKNKIYTREEMKILLLPCDKNDLRSLIGYDGLNSFLIKRLDKRQAEFDKLKEFYKGDNLSELEMIELWKATNGIAGYKADTDLESEDETNDEFSLPHWKLEDKAEANRH